MIDINGLADFDKKISFLTKSVAFDNDKFIIAKNINNISNTTTKFNFVKKVFNAMKKLSTLLMISQSGRMGIENRKENIVRYTDEINILNSRFNECFKLQNKNLKEFESKDNELKSLIMNREELKIILSNNDIFNNIIHNKKELELIINSPEKLKKTIDNNEDLKKSIDNNEKLRTIINNFLNSNKVKIEGCLQKAIDLKNKLIIEEKKIDHFLALIENENVKFKDRYSFFNYLNELKRAECFCRQSSNPSDEQLADVFKRIFEERISRVKESDVKKIYSEVIDTYHYETFFLKENKSTLAHFSSNKEKEKFLSKINFLVTVSESSLEALNNIFDKNIPDKLHEVMHTILNEEHHDAGKIISYRDTKEAWIKEYMNEFYGSERKITTQSIGTNTESERKITTQSAGTNTESERKITTQSVGTNTESKKEITTQNTSTNTESDIESRNGYDDTVNVHSRGYSADKLDAILKSEYSNLLNKELSIVKKNNIQKEIGYMLSKFYDLSSILTESLASPQLENKELIILLEKITAISNITHNIQEQLNNIESDYPVGLSENESFYSKMRGSMKNIADMLNSMAYLIERDNNDNISSIREEIENIMKNIFGEINYSMLVGKKELLDNIMELMADFISDPSEIIKDNNKIIVDEKIDDNIVKPDYYNDALEWDDVSFYLYPDDIEKEIISSLIKSIMELDMKELDDNLDDNTLNKNILKMNRENYKFISLDENE